MEENEIGRIIRDALVEKIWEGTTTVLSLDLLRATKDPTVLDSFSSWAKSTISSKSCPTSHQTTLHSAITLISTAYRSRSRSPLVPRPALMLVGYTASAVCLLEHALWSESEFDFEVFDQWVDEGGLSGAIEEVTRLLKEGGRERERVDADIVFGGLARAKL